jgi:hypothetical protein
MRVESLAACLKTSDIIEQAKKSCGISKPNSQMTDDEIRKVVRLVAQETPDTTWEGGEVKFGLVGIGLMLFLSLSEFPEFYMRYGLSQFN